MNAVVYCRVSSKEQLEGTSLESQEVACREYAQTKKFNIVKLFAEQGESAKFADRTQLLELIDFCRKNKGQVSALLVWKVDRFARNVADHFSVKTTLGKYGVQIVSVTEPIDSNPEGRLMETILAGFAEFDNAVRTTRTVQGMRRRIQEGIFPWRAPYGYKSPVVGNEKKNQPDLPDEPTFSLLRRAFSEFATGAHTQAAMGRLMESWGLTGCQGSRFAPQSLYQLFTNPFYAGIVIDPWSGKEFTGKHVHLVTREVFDNVQRVITQRSRSMSHQKQRPEFPLRGLARCDACGGGLTGAFSRGRNAVYPYYLCQKTGCPKRGKSNPAAAVHAEYLGFLDEIAIRPEFVRRIGDQLIAATHQRETDRMLQRQKLRQRANQLDTEIAELIRMRAQNLIDDEEFLAQKKKLAAQRLSLESCKDQALDPNNVRKEIEEIMAPLANLRKTWESLPLRDRARFDHMLLPGGFTVGKIRTADLGLLVSVFRRSAEIDSSEVPLACLPSNRIVEETQAFHALLLGGEEPEAPADVPVRM